MVLCGSLSDLYCTSKRKHDGNERFLFHYEVMSLFSTDVHDGIFLLLAICSSISNIQDFIQRQFYLDMKIEVVDVCFFIQGTSSLIVAN